MPLPIQQGLFQQAAAEPMQVDAAPEENDNIEDVQYVVETTSLDLEQYASQYTGLAKLNRLRFIADHCPPLRLEALRMALAYVMTTYNTNLYQQIYRKLQEALSANSSLPDAVAGAIHNVPPLDAQWIETTAKKAALKLEKLDTDLKNYKSNSIKESIRRGHDDLGDHYLDCGDLSNALKCFSRARDYCTSPKHVVNMCLNVIKVSVYLQNWSHVQSYVNKAEGTPEVTEHGKDGGQSVLTRLKCAAGLADLATKKYKSAAKYFLQASFDHCDFPELLSPHNVATYGALCALASFDRQELQKNVISSRMKTYLNRKTEVEDVEKSPLGELSPTEQYLIKSQELMWIRGELGKLVPVLIPSDAIKALNYILDPEVRKLAELKATNKYMFATRGDGVISASESLKELGSGMELIHPDRLSSTGYRAYMASIALQCLGLKDHQIQWLCTHLGHTEDVHKTHYRFALDGIERIQLAKLLLLQDRNLLSKYKNTKLEDIEFEGIVSSTSDEVAGIGEGAPRTEAVCGDDNDGGEFGPDSFEIGDVAEVDSHVHSPKKKVKNHSFKLFLELEPLLRDIIHKFYESNYASCLTLLDELKDNLYLDMYLVPHVNTLYSQIRNRALCQYFSPYLSADMGKMARAFNTTVLDLEDELMQLILEGQINARIDSHSKILYAKDTDQRSTTFEKSMIMGRDYQRRTKALILRSAVLKNQINVKCPPRDGGQGSEMSIAPGNASSARN